MGWTAAPVFAAALVIVAAGIGKIARPGGATTALRNAGLPSGDGAVQLLGLAEIVIGVAALVWGNRLTGAAIAIAYLGFAAFAALLLRRGGDTSCGCFGERRTPVTATHIIVNVAVGALAAASIAIPTGGMRELAHRPGTEIALLVAATLVGAVLLYALLALLPRRRAGAMLQRPPTNGRTNQLTGAYLDGRPAVIPLDGTPVSGRGTVLAFLSSSCLGCQPFWELFRKAEPRQIVADGIRLVIVVKDEPQDDLVALRRLAPAGVEVVRSTAAWLDFGVPGSPYFVLVDAATGRPRARDTADDWDEVVDRLDLLADRPAG